MISQIAIEELDAMKADGLDPSPSDIVRLNALGLRLEAARKKSSATSACYLPRVAKISDSISFRQPTVGHEVWLDKIERLADDDDIRTIVAIKAFATSRPCESLPDPDDPKSVKAAIGAFCDECRDFTYDQIRAAVEYVCFGSDATLGEFPIVAREDDDDDADGTDYDDWKSCISLGLLNEGKAVMLGISQADMERMTRRQLEETIHRAYMFHGFTVSNGEQERQGDFYATANAIRERLTEEKKNGR